MSRGYPPWLACRGQAQGPAPRAKTQSTPRNSQKQAENSKLEIRNSKQIQMSKTHNVRNNLDSDSWFWNFRVLVYLAAGLFRISNFEF